MTVDVTAGPNTGTRRRSHSIVPDRGDDFVLGGGELAYNGSRLSVGGGEATITNGDVVYAVSWDDTTFVPSSDGSVYVDIQDPDLADGQATGRLVGPDESAPNAPRLELGSVDVSAGTTTLVNRDPVVSVRSVRYRLNR